MKSQIKYITLFMLFAGILLTAITQAVNKHDQRTSIHGDQGYFSSNNPNNTNAMILWPGKKNNFVRRYRPGGPGSGLSYRFWLTPAYTGGEAGFPINLKTEERFNQFLEHVENSPEKDSCVWVDDPWKGYEIIGERPTQCGVHTVAIKETVCDASAGTCSETENCNGTQPGQTTSTIDNGECPPQQTCTVTAWSPASNTVCAGERLTQTRTLANCSSESQTVSGTRSCSQTCPSTAWSPASSTVCAGERLTQTRTLADCSTESQTVSGTRSCSQTCSLTVWSPNRNTVCTGERLTQTRTLADCSTDSRTVTGTRLCSQTCSVTAWSPASSTVCAGESLTQTRTLANCNIDSRTVSGTRSCPPTCPATDWSPASRTVCAGESLTQTRTLADCSSASRIVSGTRTCAPSCNYRCVMQTTGALMGTLWIMYRRCSGDTYSLPAGIYVRREDCYANLP